MSAGPGPQEPDAAAHTPDQPGGDRSIKVDGGNSGIASTGDNAVNVLISAEGISAEDTLAEMVDRLVQAVRARRSSVEDALADKACLLKQKVSDRLQREEEQQRLRDPRPLPVHWQLAPPKAPGRDSIRNAPAEATDAPPLDLAGQLDEIAAVYERTEFGWLMVLGGAGSGKSILILRFALARLKAPTPTDKAPVPVIFSFGSWNPTTTPLRDWLISQLERDQPFLAGPSPNGSTWAAALVGAGYVLPILDGFDEIANGLRGPALRALNAATLPLLVTSRHAELEAAVEATKVVPSAVGIELSDLTLDDSVNYLLCATHTTLPDGTDTTTPTGWQYVLSELRCHPHTPASANLAAVLTTPLMVTLARTVYESDRNPSELLDIELGTRKALEDHLLDNFIPTAYARFLSNRPAAEQRRWDPELARHWLGYLAAHLRKLKTHDMEWWRLGTSMNLSSQMLVVGVTVGILSGLMIGIVYGVTVGLVYGPAWWLREGAVDIPLNGLGIGLTFGFIQGFATKLKVGGPVFEPSRMHIQIRGGTKKVRESFLPRVRGGLAGGVVFGVVFGLGLATYWVLLGYPGLAIALVFGNGLVIGIALGLAVGLTLALMAGLEAVIERKTSVSPSALLNTNRTTVLTQLLAVGLVIGFGYGITIGLVNGFVVGLSVGLAAGLAVALGVGTLTAWGRWVLLARIWLPLTGRLPWAVNAFLDDAYQRGVLRQAGAVYQFRHARLRDRLGEVYEEHRNQHPA
ncbi:NACHT domain-containing protein [Streptomyces sp. NPDC002730]|uniref:NACHT domain-containing protein n=1 Tax=Streptomyces sp. NPDC002730 TaxID=3364662 RepID=UPI0036893CAC